MKITERKITIADLSKNYKDDGDGGVFAYNGKNPLEVFTDDQFARIKRVLQ